MIVTLLLSALETIINRALRCDPDALEKISALQKKIIEVDCTDWKIKFYIICDNNELQFHQKCGERPNTTIQGSLNHFLHIFMRGANTPTLFEYPIDISGDTHIIEVLRDIFKNLDLDLEEKLSGLIGDSLAHNIFFHAKQAKKILGDTNEKMTEQLKEYIYFETKHFPTKKQLEKFYKEVSTIRDDVERVEVKLHNARVREAS